VPIEVRGESFATVMYSFVGLCDSAEHLAIVAGELTPHDEPLVRIHSECLTGDVFASFRCDCGAQLRESLQLMAVRGGIILYMRQEGRGIGLYRKLDAYLLQDQGVDTFAANRCMNLPDDARDYRASAEMLRALGIQRIRLFSNNPDKVSQLERYGVAVVQRIPTGIFLTSANARYLRAKVDFAGHSIPLPEVIEP
jgi:GTP cyclohydrolase II